MIIVALVVVVVVVFFFFSAVVVDVVVVSSCDYSMRALAERVRSKSFKPLCLMCVCLSVCLLFTFGPCESVAASDTKWPNTPLLLLLLPTVGALSVSLFHATPRHTKRS
jgi:uncharacterized membrane protein YhaH (DUF805 family)